MNTGRPGPKSGGIEKFIQEAAQFESKGIYCIV